MIAAHYGRVYSLEGLREKSHISREGVSIHRKISFFVNMLQCIKYPINRGFIGKYKNSLLPMRHKYACQYSDYPLQFVAKRFFAILNFLIVLPIAIFLNFVQQR
jgi:hypothetical protein